MVTAVITICHEAVEMFIHGLALRAGPTHITFPWQHSTTAQASAPLPSFPLEACANWCLVAAATRAIP